MRGREGAAIQQFTSNAALDGAKKRNVRNVTLSPPVAKGSVMAAALADMAAKKKPEVALVAEHDEVPRGTYAMRWMLTGILLIVGAYTIEYLIRLL